MHYYEQRLRITYVYMYYIIYITVMYTLLYTYMVLYMREPRHPYVLQIRSVYT